MTHGWLPTALGTLAGLLSTASFVPQVLKAWREGDTHAISKRTYMVNVTAFVLWTLYGVLLGSFVLITFNGLSLLLAGTILVLKLRGESRENPSAAAGEPASRPRGAGQEAGPARHASDRRRDAETLDGARGS